MCWRCSTRAGYCRFFFETSQFVDDEVLAEVWIGTGWLHLGSAVALSLYRIACVLVCLLACLAFCLPACLLDFLCVLLGWLFAFVLLLACLSACLLVCCLPVRLSVCLPFGFWLSSARLSLFLVVCLSACWITQREGDTRWAAYGGGRG